MSYAITQREREQKHEYYIAHRDEMKARSKRHREEHKAEVLCWRKEFYKQNKDRLNATVRGYQRSWKMDALNAYGGPVCPTCGQTDLCALTIDHIAQFRSPEEREIGGGSGLYIWLKHNGYPPGYRVLCYNCNRKAWLEHIRAHCSQNPKTIQSRNCIAKLKLEVYAAYGGARCVTCGVDDPDMLTLDHLAGGGTKHRRENGFHGGQDFYRYLRNAGFPEGYQVLCLSCNNVKHRSIPEGESA